MRPRSVSSITALAGRNRSVLRTVMAWAFAFAALCTAAGSAALPARAGAGGGPEMPRGEHRARAPTEWIVMQARITIRTPLTRLFRFAGNPLNDPLWRSEIHSMRASGPLRAGTRFVERGRIGGVVLLTAATRTVSVQPPHLVRFAGHGDLRGRLTVERRFTPVSAAATEMRYLVRVRLDAVHEKAGWRVPAGLLVAHYRHQMNTHLRALKELTEGTGVPSGLVSRR